MPRVIPTDQSLYQGRIYINHKKSGVVDSHWIVAEDYDGALSKLVQIQNVRKALSPAFCTFPYAEVSKIGIRGDANPLTLSSSLDVGTYDDVYATAMLPFDDCILLRQVSQTYMHSNRFVHGVPDFSTSDDTFAPNDAYFSAIDDYVNSLKDNSVMVVFHKDTNTTFVEAIIKGGYVRLGSKKVGRPYGFTSGRV